MRTEGRESMSEEVLKLEKICKSFSGNYVLREAVFAVNEGEIRAIVGENGAGKSTMIKIIAGALRADSGEIFYLGENVVFSSPKESLSAGISVMYQELDLLPELSVVQNV
jgi:ABC-type sugar transport system ATPase subunit